LQSGIMSFPMSTFIAVCGFGAAIVAGLFKIGWILRGVSDKLDAVAAQQVEHQATIDILQKEQQQHTIKFVRLEQKCPLLTPLHPEQGK